jgi:hypothetical protein
MHVNASYMQIETAFQRRGHAPSLSVPAREITDTQTTCMHVGFVAPCKRGEGGCHEDDVRAVTAGINVVNIQVLEAAPSFSKSTPFGTDCSTSESTPRKNFCKHLLLRPFRMLTGTWSDIRAVTAVMLVFFKSMNLTIFS